MAQGRPLSLLWSSSRRFHPNFWSLLTLAVVSFNKWGSLGEEKEDFAPNINRRCLNLFCRIHLVDPVS